MTDLPGALLDFPRRPTVWRVIREDDEGLASDQHEEGLEDGLGLGSGMVGGKGPG